MHLIQSTEVGQPFHRNASVYEEKYNDWQMDAYEDRKATCPH